MQEFNGKFGDYKSQTKKPILSASRPNLVELSNKLNQQGRELERTETDKVLFGSQEIPSKNQESKTVNKSVKSVSQTKSKAKKAIKQVNHKAKKINVDDLAGIARQKVSKKGVKHNKVKVCLSGFTDRQRDLYEELITDVNRLTLVIDEAAFFTHLVTPKSDKMRTKKVIYALARRSYIVSEEWLEKCIDFDSIVEEKKYESEFYLKRVDRLASGQLFKGMVFSLELYNEERALEYMILESLIEICGGKVTEETDLQSKKQIILVAPKALPEQDEVDFSLKSVKDRYLSYKWVLDSIEKCEILPKSDYKI